MIDPGVTTATGGQRSAVVDTVVAAFQADPAFRFFFADRAAFDEQAAAFAGYLFDRRVPWEGVWVVDGGASVAMWDLPAVHGEASAEPGPVLDLPPDALARIDEYEQAVAAALPETPHWYLGVLATRPDRQGRGWGRAVMAYGLRAAAAVGVPAYLETTNPGNVALYRRVGWEVTRTVTVGGLTVWVMCFAPSRLG